MDEDFPPPPFDGFPADAFAFFEAIAANQDKVWFAANKARYGASVLAPLAALVAAVMDRLAADGPPLRGDPKGAVFRINRDVRFSKDKRPYKTHAGAILTRDGGKGTLGFLYLHLAPAGGFAAAGFHQPEPAALRDLRAWILAKPAGWHATEAALAACGLALGRDDALTRPPKGFDAAPADLVEALKLKSWVVRRELGRDLLMAPALVDALAGLARDAEPLLRFGWSALDHAGPRQAPGLAPNQIANRTPNFAARTGRRS